MHTPVLRALEKVLLDWHIRIKTNFIFTQMMIDGYVNQARQTDTWKQNSYFAMVVTSVYILLKLSTQPAACYQGLLYK